MWGGGIQVIRDDAQRRPERQPRLHPINQRIGAEFQIRSTKAGASTPATRIRRGTTCRIATALNEGRSVNPGYTCRLSTSRCIVMCVAQRRPERQPRLHPRRPACAQPRQSRSTKAGASTPATRIPRSTAWTRPAPLNESRSVNPGYTGLQVIGEVRGGRRSTKAGASTPATLLGTSTNRRPPRPLNEGRSVNPGYTRRRPFPHHRRSSLNEGRSVNPGYTRRPPPRYQFPRTLNEGRSVNPGYT